MYKIVIARLYVTKKLRGNCQTILSCYKTLVNVQQCGIHFKKKVKNGGSTINAYRFILNNNVEVS